MREWCGWLLRPNEYILFILSEFRKPVHYTTESFVLVYRLQYTRQGHRLHFVKLGVAEYTGIFRSMAKIPLCYVADCGILSCEA